MKKVLLAIFGGVALLFIGLLVFLVATDRLEFNNPFNDSKAADVTAAESDAVQARETAPAAVPTTMEEYYLSFDEMSVMFILENGDVIGQLESHPEGSSEKKLSCSYGAGNAMCDIKEIRYGQDAATFVIAFTRCVNGDDDGCAEKKITDYNCTIENSLVKARYPSNRLRLPDVRCK